MVAPEIPVPAVLSVTWPLSVNVVDCGVEGPVGALLLPHAVTRSGTRQTISAEIRPVETTRFMRVLLADTCENTKDKAQRPSRMTKQHGDEGYTATATARRERELHRASFGSGE
jgi:hypothetical protein